MIEKITYIESNQFSPYRNLGSGGVFASPLRG